MSAFVVLGIRLSLTLKVKDTLWGNLRILEGLVTFSMECGVPTRPRFGGQRRFLSEKRPVGQW